MSRKPRVERNRGRQVSPAAKRIALKLREMTRVAGTFEERRAMSAQIMSEALSQVVSEFAEEEHAKHHVECDAEGPGFDSSAKEGN